MSGQCVLCVAYLGEFAFLFEFEFLIFLSVLLLGARSAGSFAPPRRCAARSVATRLRHRRVVLRHRHNDGNTTDDASGSIARCWGSIASVQISVMFATHLVRNVNVNMARRHTMAV